MPVLDPSQQLALAAGQFQQSVTIPGQHGPGQHPAFAERAATGLTQGLTQGALVGGGLALGAGWSLAPMMLGKNASWGAKALAADPGAWIHAATAGRGMGPGAFRGARMLSGAAAGAASFGVPLLAAEAVMYSGRRMVEGQREFLATRQLMRELPGQGGSVLGGGGAGVFGASSDPMQVANFQSTLSNVGSSFGAAPAQMRNLVGGFGQMGMLDTSSVRSTSASLRSSMRELRSVAQTINSDLEGALEVYGQLKQMGFSSNRSRLTALKQMTGASSMSGLSLGQVSQIGGGAMQSSMAMGLSPEAGFNAGMGAISNAAYRMSTGAANPMYVQRVGGQANYAARMAEINLGVAGSEGGMNMMSRMFTEGGDFDASGFTRQVGRDRLRGSRSHFRNVDPYQMGRMRREFSEMAPGVITAQVASIQARHSDDPTRANRLQYELLSQYGIQDPDEQLEFLGGLRTQGRANALGAGQRIQNAALTSQGDRETVGVAERLGEALRDLTRRVIGSGEELERYGASLQVRLERQIRSATESLVGTPRMLATGDYSEQAISFTRSILEDPSRGRLRQNDPLGGLSSFLQGSPVSRAALGRSSGITGITNRSRLGVAGTALTMAGDFMSRAGLEPISSFATDFGGMTGMTGDAASGIYAGRLNGRDQFMTPSEYVQATALSFGQVLNPETGMFAQPDMGVVADMQYSHQRPIAAAERRIMDRIRPAHTGVLGGFNRMIGRGNDETLGDTRNIQLSDTELRNMMEGGGRVDALNEFSQAMFGSRVSDLAPQQFAEMQEVLRRQGGQIATELAGGDTGMTPWGTAASAYQQIGQSIFSNLLGGGTAGLEQQSVLGYHVDAQTLLNLQGNDTSITSFMAKHDMTGAGPFTNRVNRFFGTTASAIDRDRTFSLEDIHSRMLAEGEVGLAARLTDYATDARAAGRLDLGGRWSVARSAGGQAAGDSLSLAVDIPEEAREALGGLYADGRSLQAIGTVAGVLARAGGQTMRSMLEEYASGKSDYGSQTEAMAALQAGARAGSKSTSLKASEVLERYIINLREEYAGDDEALARINTASRSLLRDGRLREAAIDPGTINDLYVGYAGSTNADARAAAEELVGEGRAVTHLALEAGGRAVAGEVAAEGLNTMRRGYLRQLSMAGVQQSFDLGDRTVNASELREMAASGAISLEQANAAFADIDNNALSELLGAARESGDTGTANILRNIQRLRQGTGSAQGGQSAYEIMQGMVSSVFGAGGQVTEDDISMFSGLPALQSTMTLAAQVQRTPGDTEEDHRLLVEMFGSEEALEAFLDRAKIGETGGDLEDRAAIFSRGLETPGGLRDDHIAAFIHSMSAKFTLGDEGRRTILQETREGLQEEYYRSMNDALKTGGIPVRGPTRSPLTGGGRAEQMPEGGG